jgi:hypothetical protein
MPDPQPQGPVRPHDREELERKLLAEVKQLEREFQEASPDRKEAVGERYRAALQRFNDVILKRPPGCAEQL